MAHTMAADDHIKLIGKLLEKDLLLSCLFCQDPGWCKIRNLLVKGIVIGRALG